MLTPNLKSQIIWERRRTWWGNLHRLSNLMTPCMGESMCWRRERNNPRRKYLMLLKRNKRLRNPSKENKPWIKRNSNLKWRSRKSCMRKQSRHRVQSNRESSSLLKDAKTKLIMRLRSMRLRARDHNKGKNTSTTGKRWNWRTTRLCTSKVAIVNWIWRVKSKVLTRLSVAQYQATRRETWNRWALRLLGKRGKWHA